MSFLTALKVILVITVIGLYLWTFHSGENESTVDASKYGTYMICLLVFEVAVIVVFSVL